ncbi:fungal-specific transcription factor domain-containing protein [Aspergillus aurantiobrunneus]
MADQYDPPRLRAATACIACNKKKVRCVYGENSHKCQNCLRHQWPCLQPSHPVLCSLNGPQEISPPSTTWLSNSAAPWRGSGITPTSKNADVSWNPYTSITAPSGFMERNDYFRETDSITHDDGVLPVRPADIPSDEDVQLLQLQRAFDIPPRVVRESLIDVFMKRCAPWMPIVERSWLQDNNSNKPSILLLQSVFLAASRVTSAPAVSAYASSQEFYRRAKALFYAGWEKNPLTVIAAVCFLHWYNPECPEYVSTNTSAFWRYVGVGLAHQIGLHKEPSNTEGKALRRRLWWSLFARDCLISAGQGRPLAVNLCDSELRPPSADDFRDSSLSPDLFMSYVEICSILGHLTQCCRRDSLTRRVRLSVSRSLQRWIHELPPSLRLFHDTESSEDMVGGKSLSPYNFEARQIHISYFVCLIILCRSPSAHQPPSAAAILASAHVVAIFEEFLARDEIQYLGSIFTFHLLAAGIGMLSCRRIPPLWSKAAPDMQTVHASLEQLAKRWPSAMAPLRALKTIADKQRPVAMPIAVPSLPDDNRAFFDTLGPGLTWAWEDFMHPMLHYNGEQIEDGLEDLGLSTTSARMGEDASITNNLPTHNMTLDPTTNFSDFGAQHATEDGLFQFQYEGIGDWLLNDCGVYGDIMS